MMTSLHHKHGAPLPVKKGSMSRKARGATILELLVGMTVFVMASSVTFMALMPAFRDARLVGAYDSVLMLMRQTREAAIVNRKTYLLTFNPGGTPVGTNQVTVQRIDAGVLSGVLSTMVLPQEVQFTIIPGTPNTNAAAPDSLGSGSQAIQFDIGVNGGQANQVYFFPDGSAKDINNNINNGIVYMGRQGDLYTMRAITLFGVSGRVRGWRLMKPTSGAAHWSQQ